MTRQLAELRHATRIVMVRHRVLRWTPPPPVPEWLRRGKLAKDTTSLVLG